MTTHERLSLTYAHKEADRMPIYGGGPWGTTLERWRREGMPAEVEYEEYFDLDVTVGFGADNSPRFEGITLEETEEYIIATNCWGTTAKMWKHKTSTPGFISHTVVDRDSWKKVKQRMVPSRDRIDWKYLKANYAAWRERGYWISGGPFFGFDGTHGCMTGMEQLLIAMAEDPEWVKEIFDYELDVALKLLEMAWDEGYTLDSLDWNDDMGYRNGLIFSPEMYRAVLKPAHARAIEWAHNRGIKTHLHSCGNIIELIPDLIDIGLDALNPLEVKAGMDPAAIKKQYGDSLVLHGGINAALFSDPGAVEKAVRKLLPVMIENGGYIFCVDHSVPDNVSLKEYRSIIELAKKLGSYQ